MNEIWYLLKYPSDGTGSEEKWSRFVKSGKIEEIAFFQYHRLIRYGGQWHLEKRPLLPGCIFLSGRKLAALEKVPLIPCEIQYIKDMCQENNVIGISQGFIQSGKTVVTTGPLKGREQLIRNIDRHKRTARIEIPFGGDKREITVGLEICRKT